MNEQLQLSIITEALSMLPASVRDDYQGIAFVKLQDVLNQPRAEQVTAIRRHVEYQRRQERSSALDPVDREDGAGGRDFLAVELKDELTKLSPQDRTIVLMIAASNTFQEIADALGLSPATITRRLKRIREHARAD